MNQEEQKKQFVLGLDDARQLASTCTTFYKCGDIGLTHVCLPDLLDLIGPLPSDLDQARCAIVLELEMLENQLDLAAQFGDWYKEMVEQIRRYWLVADIINLFRLLWIHEKNQLCVA